MIRAFIWASTKASYKLAQKAASKKISHTCETIASMYEKSVNRNRYTPFTSTLPYQCDNDKTYSFQKPFCFMKGEQFSILNALKGARNNEIKAPRNHPTELEWEMKHNIKCKKMHSRNSKKWRRAAEKSKKKNKRRKKRKHNLPQQPIDNPEMLPAIPSLLLREDTQSSILNQYLSKLPKANFLSGRPINYYPPPRAVDTTFGSLRAKLHDFNGPNPYDANGTRHYTDRLKVESLKYLRQVNLSDELFGKNDERGLVTERMKAHCYSEEELNLLGKSNRAFASRPKLVLQASDFFIDKETSRWLALQRQSCKEWEMNILREIHARAEAKARSQWRMPIKPHEVEWINSIPANEIPRWYHYLLDHLQPVPFRHRLLNGLLQFPEKCTMWNWYCRSKIIVFVELAKSKGRGTWVGETKLGKVIFKRKYRLCPREEQTIYDEIDWYSLPDTDGAADIRYFKRFDEFPNETGKSLHVFPKPKKRVTKMVSILKGGKLSSKNSKGSCRDFEVSKKSHISDFASPAVKFNPKILLGRFTRCIPITEDKLLMASRQGIGFGRINVEYVTDEELTSNDNHSGEEIGLTENPKEIQSCNKAMHPEIRQEDPFYYLADMQSLHVNCTPELMHGSEVPLKRLSKSLISNIGETLQQRPISDHKPFTDSMQQDNVFFPDSKFVSETPFRRKPLEVCSVRKTSSSRSMKDYKIVSFEDTAPIYKHIAPSLALRTIEESNGWENYAVHFCQSVSRPELHHAFEGDSWPQTRHMAVGFALSSHVSNKTFKEFSNIESKDSDGAFTWQLVPSYGTRKAFLVEGNSAVSTERKKDATLSTFHHAKGMNKNGIINSQSRVIHFMECCPDNSNHRSMDLLPQSTKSTDLLPYDLRNRPRKGSITISKKLAVKLLTATHKKTGRFPSTAHLSFSLCYSSEHLSTPRVMKSTLGKTLSNTNHADHPMIGHIFPSYSDVSSILRKYYRRRPNEIEMQKYFELYTVISLSGKKGFTKLMRYYDLALLGRLQVVKEICSFNDYLAGNRLGRRFHESQSEKILAWFPLLKRKKDSFKGLFSKNKLKNTKDRGVFNKGTKIETLPHEYCYELQKMQNLKNSPLPIHFMGSRDEHVSLFGRAWKRYTPEEVRALSLYFGYASYPRVPKAIYQHLKWSKVKIEVPLLNSQKRNSAISWNFQHPGTDTHSMRNVYCQKPEEITNTANFGTPKSTKNLKSYTSNRSRGSATYDCHADYERFSLTSSNSDVSPVASSATLDGRRGFERESASSSCSTSNPMSNESKTKEAVQRGHMSVRDTEREKSLVKDVSKLSSWMFTSDSIPLEVLDDVIGYIAERCADVSVPPTS
ncbi:hypothetical protein FT663_05309 [Candidozyma haemuli var. vulneris]|nr:hypothetical protein FT663_05309 [[Candida] haemuloni var. vulneris]KAF3985624.1 hypothetical protein FT662_05041 [[Candida] haemuloni var. vulneris]